MAFDCLLQPAGFSPCSPVTFLNWDIAHRYNLRLTRRRRRTLSVDHRVTTAELRLNHFSVVCTQDKRQVQIQVSQHQKRCNNPVKSEFSSRAPHQIGQ